MTKVKVLDRGKVIGHVPYEPNLGSPKNVPWCLSGVSRLRNGRYVLMYHTDINYQEPVAYAATKQEARDAIIASGRLHLLSIYGLE